MIQKFTDGQLNMLNDSLPAIQQVGLAQKIQEIIDAVNHGGGGSVRFSNFDGSLNFSASTDSNEDFTDIGNSVWAIIPFLEQGKTIIGLSALVNAYINYTGTNPITFRIKMICYDQNFNPIIEKYSQEITTNNISDFIVSLKTQELIQSESTGIKAFEIRFQYKGDVVLGIFGTSGNPLHNLEMKYQ